MTKYTLRRDHSASAHSNEQDRETTRLRLLDAAGQVFAEKGFDRATGKEIAEKAGTTAAAVNYYFGGMEGLYTTVVAEAHSRLVTFDALTAAMAGKSDPEAKLDAFINLVVRTLTGPVSSSWVLRVIGREFVAPSPALEALRKQELLPKAGVLKAIVAEIMGLPVDDPAVERGCVSVIAPAVILVIADRQTLECAFPKFGFDPSEVDSVARDMVRYAMAGLSAIANEAKQKRV